MRVGIFIIISILILSSNCFTQTPTDLASNEPIVNADDSNSNNQSSSGLDSTFRSEKYKFSIKHPSNWVVRDQSDSIKKKQGMPDVWFVFGTEPIANSKIVFNLRRMKIDSSTDAETFAKHNTYVKDWKRETINGNPAFSNIIGSPEIGRVTHRTIILMNGYAWMLNAIDTSKEPVEKSKTLFRAMVESLKV
ncbi:MAG: hypothetical protein SNJ70_10470 [Armatimonadota bacterium]